MQNLNFIFWHAKVELCWNKFGAIVPSNVISCRVCWLPPANFSNLHNFCCFFSNNKQGGLYSQSQICGNHNIQELTCFFTRNNQKKHLTCIYWETNISYHIKFKLSPDKFWQVTNEEIFQFFCHLVFPPLCVMYQTNKNHN